MSCPRRTRPSRTPSPRPSARPTRAATTRCRRPPAQRRTSRRARPRSRRHDGRRPRPVTAAPDGGGAPRRARRRDHQHRGRVGNADHVPDPPGVRGATGDGERVEHDRPGPGSGLRGVRLPARADRPAEPHHPARRRVAARRCDRCRPAAVAPVVGLLRDRTGPDRGRPAAGRLPAPDLCLGRCSARGRPRAPGPLVGLALGRGDRRVRRVLRRGPGRDPDGRPRDRRSTTRCSG